MDFIACEHNDGCTDHYNCADCAFKSNEGLNESFEKSYMSKSQCLAALRLSQENGHWWADAHQGIKEFFQNSSKKSIQFDELEDIYASSEMSDDRRISPELNANGTWVHYTCSNRTMWEIFRDGGVNISTNRPGRNHVLFTSISPRGELQNLGSGDLIQHAEGRHFAEHLRYLSVFLSDWQIAQTDWGRQILHTALEFQLHEIREEIVHAPLYSYDEQRLLSLREEHERIVRRINVLPFKLEVGAFPVMPYLNLARTLRKA